MSDTALAAGLALREGRGGEDGKGRAGEALVVTKEGEQEGVEQRGRRKKETREGGGECMKIAMLGERGERRERRRRRVRFERIIRVITRV